MAVFGDRTYSFYSRAQSYSALAMGYIARSIKAISKVASRAELEPIEVISEEPPVEPIRFWAKPSRFDPSELDQYRKLRDCVPPEYQVFAGPRLTDFLALSDPSDHLEYALAMERNRVPFLICDNSTRPVLVVRFLTENDEESRRWVDRLTPILNSVGLQTIAFESEQSDRDTIRSSIAEVCAAAS